MPDQYDGATGTGSMLAVDAVYVVHVRTGAEERAVSIERQAALHGFTFSYMLDGDIADLTPALLGRWFKGRRARPGGLTSCTVKHFLIYERMLQERRRDALVLEDDMILADDFVPAVNQSLSELRKRTDARPELSFISFENSGLKPVSNARPDVTLYRADHGRCTGAYWLSAQVAERFLTRAEREKTELPIGHYQNRFFHSGEVDVWWRQPAIAEQGSHSGVFDSTLSPRYRRGWLRKMIWELMKVYHLRVRPRVGRWLGG